MPGLPTQSIFQPTDFDLFLDEVGLGEMTPEARIQLVDNLRQAISYRIVTEIYTQLSVEQKTQLVELMQKADETGDEKPVNDFLLKCIPDVEALVDDIVESEKNKLRPGAAMFQKFLEGYLATLERKVEEKTGQPVNSSIPPVELPQQPAAPASPTTPLPEPTPKAPTFDDVFPWEKQADLQIKSETEAEPETAEASDKDDSSKAITDELEAADDSY